MRRTWLPLLLACACSSSEAGGGVTALFEVPRAGAPPPDGFYALPFPSDIRVGDDGAIDLADHPRLNDLVGLYLDTIMAEQRGFGLSSAGFLRFDGALDPASLPATPEASLDPAAAVYLVDIDPDSPARGTRTPVLTKFTEAAGEAIGPDWLAVLPYPGFPLAERTTYALVATRRLRAADGDPVLADDDFAAVMAGEPPDDPDLARAQALYQPLADWLDEAGGDERADVAAAAVFTTGAPTDLLGAIREVIRRDVPEPEARDVVLVDQQDGYRWFDGHYDGPNFQRGEVPYLEAGEGGDIAIDPATGEPVVQRMEDLRFSMTIPTGTRPAGGWPVAIYAHGTGGDYHSFEADGTARWLAAAGIACISIDQVLHGPRNPDTSPDAAFFNLQNPLAARDNTLQGALDDFQLLRLVQGMDLSADGIRIVFDPDRIFFFGHSQGSLTGVPFVAHEPEVKAAIFSGAGGLLYLALLNKTEPVDIAGLIRLFLRDDPLDQFHPVLALLQMYMERADAVSYARRLATNVFISEGLIDRYTPVPSIEALATAMRVDLVSPVHSDVIGLTLAGHDVLDAPVSGNWNGGATGVLLQYEEVPDSDGHFVIFDREDARQQSTQFLASEAADGVSTLIAQ
jgi:predicted esterase